MDIPDLPLRIVSRIILIVLVVLTIALLPVSILHAAAGFSTDEASTIRESIRQRIEWLTFGDRNSVAGEPVPSRVLSAQLYADAHYRPFWRSREKIEQLWEIAAMAEAQGLNRWDYPLAALRTLLPARGLPLKPASRADLDLLATDTLIRMTYQLRFGRTAPENGSSAWNFDRPLLNGERSLDTIAGLIASESLAEQLSSLFDRGAYYQRWVMLLKDHRRLHAQGGWPVLSEGPTLRLGDRGAHVLELRRRIAVTDTLRETRHEGFDPALEEAVRAFQDRHGLEIDGIVGPRTRAALNVNVEDRIGQIRAALERARWVLDDFHVLPEAMVLVNIASAQVRFLRRWQSVWSGRAVVGQPKRQTPTFRDEIDYLVFNPAWTVPPTILEQDILPAVRRDGPEHLESRHMEVLDSQGSPVDPSLVDWSVTHADDFAYSIRQTPGPWNVLGRIKFVFPNSQFIFMHDTPSCELFGRTRRALSSGCVRVDGPFRLAELLLADSERWHPAAFDSLLEQEGPQVVHLPRPVPIILLYATADTDEDGVAHFYKDIYQLDAILLAALDAKPRFREP